MRKQGRKRLTSGPIRASVRDVLRSLSPSARSLVLLTRSLPRAAAFCAATIALLLLGCASARRATQKPVEMNDAQERVLGARMAAAFEDGETIYLDRQVNGYVNQIGQRIARLSDKPTIPYTFRLVNGAAPRGVVLPRGHLYLSTGLLRRIRSQ